MNGTQLSLFGPSYRKLLPAPPRNDVRIGDAARKTLVIYRLLMLDCDTHTSRRDAAYDVVVDLHDGRVLGIPSQVVQQSKYGGGGAALTAGVVLGGSEYRYARRNS